jgi:hypothetical protein
VLTRGISAPRIALCVAIIAQATLAFTPGTPVARAQTTQPGSGGRIFLPMLTHSVSDPSQTTCETFSDGHVHCHGDAHVAADAIPTLAEEARILETIERTKVGWRGALDYAQAVDGNEHIVGKWEGPYAWPVIAIHAALMPNGKVVAFDSVGDNPTESYTNHTYTRATVWDPATNTHVDAQANTGFNLFCSGFSKLNDGRLFTAGGNKNSALQGINRTHTFNPNGNVWSLEGTMAAERWYPSVTPLNNGEMLITGGGANTPEIRATNGALRQLTGANAAIANDRVYHWLRQAPNGQVFYIGPSTNLQYLNTGGTGGWQSAGSRDGVYRDYGSFAMYDVGRILVTGGGSTASNSAVTININGASPATAATSAMAFRRKQHNLTMLPDGSVLATGGLSTSGLVDLPNAVYAAERWNPANGAWTTLASMTVARQYHSISMLLPDGRVLVAGGGICGECQSENYMAKNAEIYSPPYLFRTDGSGQLAPRPAIQSAPGVINLNQTFTINTPQAASINKVALIRLSSVTHSANQEERYIPLSFTRGSGAIQAVAPNSANIAPPGHYMLFIVDAAGVPSVAPIVFLSNTTAPTPTPGPTATSTATATPVATATPTSTPRPPTATPAPGNAQVTIVVVRPDFSPLVGWSVSAEAFAGGVVNRVTDANGSAAFALAPGGYRICQTPQPGWSNVYPGSDCYWISFSAGDVLTLYFRNQQTNAPTATPAPPTPTPTAVPGGGVPVSVYVVRDNYAPLSGWTVTAESFASGALTTRTTDANGLATFILPPGGYKICYVLQAGWTNTYPGNTCYWINYVAGDSGTLFFRNTQ